MARKSIVVYIVCFLLMAASATCAIEFMSLSFGGLAAANNGKVCSSVLQQIAFIGSAILYVLVSIASLVTGFLSIKVVTGIEQFCADWLKHKKE